MEMVFFDLILNPIKAHIHGLWFFLAKCIIYDAVCSGIVIFCGCCWVVRIGSASWKFWKRAPTSASVADPITFFIMFDTVCTAPFISLVFWSFGTPWRSSLLLWCGPWVLIIIIYWCGLSVSCCWSDIVVLHLDEMYSSLKIGVLHPLLSCFFLLALLRLIQVPLVRLSWMPINNI